MKFNFLKKNEPVSIREVSLQYKDKPVSSKFKDIKETPVVDADIVYELFEELRNEGTEKLITISLDKNLRIIKVSKYQTMALMDEWII